MKKKIFTLFAAAIFSLNADVQDDLDDDIPHYKCHQEHVARAPKKASLTLTGPMRSPVYQMGFQSMTFYNGRRTSLQYAAATLFPKVRKQNGDFYMGLGVSAPFGKNVSVVIPTFFGYKGKVAAVDLGCNLISSKKKESRSLDDISPTVRVGVKL